MGHTMVVSAETSASMGHEEMRPLLLGLAGILAWLYLRSVGLGLTRGIVSQVYMSLLLLPASRQ